MNETLRNLYARLEQLCSQKDIGEGKNLLKNGLTVLRSDFFVLFTLEVRPISRPKQNQRIVYNGHKRVHGFKFEQVLAANGIIARMFGPVGTIT